MDGRRLVIGVCSGKGEATFRISTSQTTSILFLPSSLALHMFHLPRMTTVHEEKVVKSNNSSAKAVNGAEAASHQMAPPCSLPASRTCDSLQELAAPKLPSGGSAPPGNSPSLVSSGYGSQAASSTNLSR